jgi:hypothetical protein
LTKDYNFSPAIILARAIFKNISPFLHFKFTDGGWSNWMSWSSCSVTCTNGTKTRSRLCNNPTPQNGGADCSGLSQDLLNCSAGACIISESIIKCRLLINKIIRIYKKIASKNCIGNVLEFVIITVNILIFVKELHSSGTFSTIVFSLQLFKLLSTRQGRKLHSITPQFTTTLQLTLRLSILP